LSLSRCVSQLASDALHGTLLMPSTPPTDFSILAIILARNEQHSSDDSHGVHIACYRVFCVGDIGNNGVVLDVSICAR
jgi:hypothetical protein